LRCTTLLCESASRLLEAGAPEGVQEVLIAKYVGALAARDAARSAVQILGARGLMEGEASERFLRDSAVMEVIEGSTEMCQIMIAGGAGYAA
jgi:methoxymalonate biosynthesis protein